MISSGSKTNGTWLYFSCLIKLEMHLDSLISEVQMTFLEHRYSNIVLLFENKLESSYCKLSTATTTSYIFLLGSWTIKRPIEMRCLVVMGKFWSEIFFFLFCIMRYSFGLEHLVFKVSVSLDCWWLSKNSIISSNQKNLSNITTWMILCVSREKNH